MVENVAGTGLGRVMRVIPEGGVLSLSAVTAPNLRVLDQVEEPVWTLPRLVGHDAMDLRLADGSHRTAVFSPLDGVQDTGALYAEAAHAAHTAVATGADAKARAVVLAGVPGDTYASSYFPLLMQVRSSAGELSVLGARELGDAHIVGDVHPAIQGLFGLDRWGAVRSLDVRSDAARLAEPVDVDSGMSAATKTSQVANRALRDEGVVISQIAQYAHDLTGKVVGRLIGRGVEDIPINVEHPLGQPAGYRSHREAISVLKTHRSAGLVLKARVGARKQERRYIPLQTNMPVEQFVTGKRYNFRSERQVFDQGEQHTGKWPNNHWYFPTIEAVRDGNDWNRSSATNYDSILFRDLGR